MYVHSFPLLVYFCLLKKSQTLDHQKSQVQATEICWGKTSKVICTAAKVVMVHECLGKLSLRTCSCVVACACQSGNASCHIIVLTAPFFFFFFIQISDHALYNTAIPIQSSFIKYFCRVLRNFLMHYNLIKNSLGTTIL